MLLTFEEYIKEGLWSKGVDRSKSGEERLENKVVLNTNEFKEIDLGFPFVFANIDLTVDGDEKITWLKFEDIKLQIERTGWRLPGWHELKKLLFKFAGNPPELNDDLNVYTKYEMNKTFVYVKSKKTDEMLEFVIDNPYGQSYWCGYDKTSLEKNSALIKNARIMRINDPKYAYNGMLFSFENEDKNEKLKIRLVKDK